MDFLIKNEIKRAIQEENENKIDVALTKYAQKHIKPKWNIEKQFNALIKMPIGIQYHYSTGILKFEVDNGGFTQFLFNSSKIYLFAVRKGYKEIGAVQHYELINSIIEHLHSKYNITLDLNDYELIRKIQELKMKLNSDWKKFKAFMDVEQFDDRFYSLEENEGPIWEMLLEYIKTNPEKFL